MQERQPHEIEDGAAAAHASEQDAPGRSTDQLQGPNQPMQSGLLQRDANGVADGAHDSVGAASKGGGSALPGELKGQFEKSLGTDLSDVRVHTGGDSASAAGAVGAKAYAVGQDIHMGAGQYEPSSPAGQKLLAHEVAHTVQQRGGAPMQQNKLEVSTPQDGHEHEADSAADKMVSGEPASVTKGAPQKIARDVDDKVVTPMDPNAPGASVGIAGKIDTTGAQVSAPITISKPFKGPYCETTAAVVITPTGVLKWPDPTNGKVKFGLGASNTKGTDQTGATAVEQPVEKEIQLYKKQVEKQAADEKHQKDWMDGYQVVDVKLIPGVAPGVGSKKDALEEKPELGIGAKLKVVATLKNKTELSGAVTLISVKHPYKIEGPKLQAQIQSPPVQAGPWNLGKGWTFDGTVTVAGTLEVKPDYTQLAEQFATTIAEAGVAGCLEAAGIVAVSVAPLVVLASAFSMIEDETKLFHFTYAEARDAKNALSALITGTVGEEPLGYSSAREKDAYAKGREAAKKAMAEKGIDEAAYKAMFEQEKWRREELFNRCWHEAENKFTGAVCGQAASIYKKSWSLRFWKEEGEFMSKWMTTANQAWYSHQSNA